MFSCCVYVFFWRVPSSTATASQIIVERVFFSPSIFFFSLKSLSIFKIRLGTSANNRQ